MGPPDPLNRGQADAGDLGHHPTGPVGGLAGRLAERQSDDPLGDLVGHLGNPRQPQLIAQQAFDPGLHEPRLPAPDGGLADAGGAHNLNRAEAIGGGQNDPRAPDVLLRAVAVIDHRLQALAIGRAQVDGDAAAHPAAPHDPALRGNPARTLMSASIH